MINRYELQAKRPHELVFTNWCSTDDYEAVKRNIAVIESYGWQWQLEEGEFEDTDCKWHGTYDEMDYLGERCKYYYSKEKAYKKKGADNEQRETD